MSHSESVADFNSKRTDKEFTSKFYENFEEQFSKSFAKDNTGQKDKTSKKKLIDMVDKWLDDHPAEFMGTICVGTIYISYKLYQRMIAGAIFKANKKTIDYIIKNCAVYRVEQ